LQFLANVSLNLKDGGYFIGTVPDGKRVNDCSYSRGRRGTYNSQMLRVEARWQGQPACFGSPYICAIGDTVTGSELKKGGRAAACCAGRQREGCSLLLLLLLCAPLRLQPAAGMPASGQPTLAHAPTHTHPAGEKGTEGSLEYLVYGNVLVQLAGQYGLRPVLRYDCPALDELLEEVRRGGGGDEGKEEG
jgi:hypothetical protein